MNHLDGTRSPRSGRIVSASLMAGVVAIVLALSGAPVAATSGGQANLAVARGATARFHDLPAAQAAGYSVVVADLAGITCIDDPEMGAMGVHYLNLSLAPELADPTAAASVDATTPELLVYAPGPNGQLRLVALEYLALRANWDANHSAPPSLFGQTFDLTLAGNRYGLPDFYSLHTWIWDPNPIDMFAGFNPRVSCAAAAD
jgi:hypothetical protein